MEGMSVESTVCMVGYVVFTTFGLRYLGDSSTPSFLMQIAGAWVVGIHCGLMDGKS